MAQNISPLAHIDPAAIIADDVRIGPFCLIGPDVEIGSGCILDSHVTVIGHTTIGVRNRFHANCVIGDEPQDLGYSGAPTYVEIGDDNVFREGVTVHRGAEKEDFVTRIGNRNYLMANSHVGHNSHVYNNTMLVNGCLLGGHVHVYDYATVSGNSCIHQFASVGTLGFVAGGCRVPTDVPPYMMGAGSDNPEIVAVNIIGMKRRGIPDTTISVIRQAYKLLFREHKKLEEVSQHFFDTLGGIIPWELTNLLRFLEQQKQGRNGRGRESVRSKPACPDPMRRSA